MKSGRLFRWIPGIGICALSCSLALAAPMPPVTVSAEPTENGRLVYLPLPPPTEKDSATYMFGLRLDIRNNNPTNSITLQTIRLEFTYPSGDVAQYLIIRGVDIGANALRKDYFKEADPQEVIQLADPPPTRVRIELYFQGYPDPAVLERNLAPYHAPTPTGSYLFPGNAADLPKGELWDHVDPHSGGEQLFAYDFHVVGWDPKNSRYATVKPGTDGSMNTNALGWGVPVYAMADGVVLWARNDYINNPKAGDRAIQRMGAVTAGPVSDVKVTHIKSPLSNDRPFSGRVATVARNASGILEITVWDLDDFGTQIQQKGSATGEPAQLVATDGLSETRLVTATRSLLGVLRLTVWNLSADGMTVTPLGHVDVEPIQEVAVATLFNNAFTTVATAPDKTQHLTLWQVSADGMNITPVVDDFAEPATSLSVVKLKVSTTDGTGRLASSFRNADGRLQMIVWDFNTSKGKVDLERKGDNTGDLITEATLLTRSDSTSKVLATMRTSAGNLKVQRWSVSANGKQVSPDSSDFEVTDGAIQKLAVAPSRGGDPDTFTTSVISQGGKLQNFLWTTGGVHKEEGTALEQWGMSEEESAGTVSIEEFLQGGGLMAGAIRTDGGNLRIITWRIARDGGNELRILHGNCRMVYAHFQAGSMNPEIAYPGARVVAGQFLARMGNSGKSEGVHTHIHAVIVDESLSLGELIESERVNSHSHLLAFRPIPFHCALAARKNSLSEDGVANTANWFYPAIGHGFYFTQFGVYPNWQLDTYVDLNSDCPAPRGQKMCTSGYFGPYPLISQALLNNVCWGPNLYIRKGNYNESLVLTRGMIVRSYDGPAVIGVP